MRDWTGQLHLDECPTDVALVIEGKISGTDFFFSQCDGKFTDEDLNEQGNLFTLFYYGENGNFLSDYEKNFEKQMYVAPEMAHDFKKFSAMVNARFHEWSNPANTKKRWWKFW